MRNVDGETEILKDSNSTANKIFIESSEANLLVKKLNENTDGRMQWFVRKM